MVERIELGCAGHLLVASSCQWRRHTRVGDYRISTVGNYYYPDEDGERKPVGCNRFFETMVFCVTGDCEDDEGCGCGNADFSEIDMDGYNTAGEAHVGHEQMVEKYLAIADKENENGSTQGA